MALHFKVVVVGFLINMYTIYIYIHLKAFKSVQVGLETQWEINDTHFGGPILTERLPHAHGPFSEVCTSRFVDEIVIRPVQRASQGIWVTAPFLRGLHICADNIEPTKALSSEESPLTHEVC